MSFVDHLNEQLNSIADEINCAELVVTDAPSPSANIHDIAAAAATPCSSPKQSMTRVELIKIILTLQEMQNIQMDRLQELVNRMDATKENTKPASSAVRAAAASASETFNENSSDQATSQQHKQQSKRHWTVGRPLETLMEVDQETESIHLLSTSLKDVAATNQSSMKENSRSLTNKALETASDQNLTATELTKEQVLDDALQGGDAELEQPTANEKHNAYSAPRSIRESMMKEDFDDNSHGQEDNSQQYDDDGNDADVSAWHVDDSALYCPTIVASGRKQQQQRQQNQQQPHQQHLYRLNSMASPMPKTPLNRHRISHVNVPVPHASPAPTVFTMDNSLDSTWWRSNSMIDNDDLQSIASEETPVLNRYRVNNDDRSPHGYVVVPNQRRPHRHGRSTATKKQQRNVRMQLPPLHASAAKQVFRKTPHRPVSRLRLPSTPTIDEHRPFEKSQQQQRDNLLDLYNDLDDESLLVSPVSSPEGKKATAGDPSNINRAARKNDDPAARPLDTAQGTNETFRPPTDIHVSFADGEPNGRNEYLLSSSVTYAKARVIDMEQEEQTQASNTAARRRHSAMASLTSKLEQSPSLLSDSPLLAKDRRFSTLAQSYSNARRIQPISQHDYDNAPRIVQMQVTLSEVQASTRLLNEALDIGTLAHQFTESRAKSILAPLGFSQRKCKTVLMSLCHWQRLMMRRLSQFGGSGSLSIGSSAEQPLGLVFEVA